MKNLLILATIFFAFNFTNAQSKIFSTDNSGYSARQIGKYENGKIYSTDNSGYSARQVGKIEGGKIFSTDSSGYSARQVGKFEGGFISGAAAGFLLLL